MIDNYDEEDSSNSVTDDDVTFDEHLYRGTSHQEYDDRLLTALQRGREFVNGFIVDEFITEAYVSACQIRNILGDADAHAADLTNTILTNLLVVLQNITQDPAGFLVAFLNAIPDDQERNTRLETIINKLHGFVSARSDQAT